MSQRSVDNKLYVSKVSKVEFSPKGSISNLVSLQDDALNCGVRSLRSFGAGDFVMLIGGVVAAGDKNSDSWEAGTISVVNPLQRFGCREWVIDFR